MTLTIATQSLILFIVGMFLFFATMDMCAAIDRAATAVWANHKYKKERQVWEATLAVASLTQLRNQCDRLGIAHKKRWSRNKLFQELIHFDLLDKQADTKAVTSKEVPATTTFKRKTKTTSRKRRTTKRLAAAA